VVEDGTDEDQARAEKMDQWIAWEAEERGRHEERAEAEFDTFFFSFLFFSFICSGDSYSGLCAQRTLRAEDFICCGDDRGSKSVSSVRRSGMAGPHTPRG